VPNETGFSILKYSGQSAAIAACQGCQLKFFTPANLMREGVGREGYLRKKYNEHWCAVAVAHNQQRRKLLQRRRAFFLAKW
jgi:hypothetical protein